MVRVGLCPFPGLLRTGLRAATTAAAGAADDDEEGVENAADEVAGQTNNVRAAAHGVSAGTPLFGFRGAKPLSACRGQTISKAYRRVQELG